MGVAKGCEREVGCSLVYAGEFNVIRYLSSRLRCNRFSFEIFYFSDIIGEFNMIDLPLKEGYVQIVGGW